MVSNCSKPTPSSPRFRCGLHGFSPPRPPWHSPNAAWKLRTLDASGPNDARLWGPIFFKDCETWKFSKVFYFLIFSQISPLLRFISLILVCNLVGTKPTSLQQSKSTLQRSVSFISVQMQSSLWLENLWKVTSCYLCKLCKPDWQATESAACAAWFSWGP